MCFMFGLLTFLCNEIGIPLPRTYHGIRLVRVWLGDIQLPCRSNLRVLLYSIQSQFNFLTRLFTCFEFTILMPKTAFHLQALVISLRSMEAFILRSGISITTLRCLYRSFYGIYLQLFFFLFLNTLLTVRLNIFIS